MNGKLAAFGAASILCLALSITGCSRTVSRTSDVKVRNDGSMKTTEKTVTQNPDGSLTKSETKTDTKR